jgi:hypothetical protein
MPLQQGEIQNLHERETERMSLYSGWGRAAVRWTEIYTYFLVGNVNVLDYAGVGNAVHFIVADEPNFSLYVFIQVQVINLLQGIWQQPRSCHVPWTDYRRMQHLWLPDQRFPSRWSLIPTAILVPYIESYLRI